MPAVPVTNLNLTSIMPNKHSQSELVRLLELGIREVGDLDSERFYILVQNVVAIGKPPAKLVATVLVRFLPAGAPYCCGEPSCYSNVFRDAGARELGEFMRGKMKLRQTVDVALNILSEYYDGIKFSSHR